MRGIQKWETVFGKIVKTFISKILKYPENSFCFNPVSESELLVTEGELRDVLFQKDGLYGVE